MSTQEDTHINSCDRILPNQELLKMHYREDSSEYFSRLHDLLVSFHKEGNIGIEKFNLELPENFSFYYMGSDLPSLHFLQFVIRMCNYKEILEIGTFVGVSAMHMCDATSDGHVTTVEIGKDFYEIAKRNVENNGYGDRVSLIHANADKLVNLLDKEKKFDLIYLDGDKDNYASLFKMLFPYLSQRGTFIVDDVLFNGDVLNESPATKKGAGVKELISYVNSQDNLDVVLLPLSNGKLFIRNSN